MTAVWTLHEVFATGEYLLAAETSREGLLVLLGRKVGRVIPPHDVQETARGWKVLVDSSVYTIREVPLGEWLR